ncbi:MAG: MATE family efflux transporter [Acidimicrobiaceae bacterium]|nr:MATE family efflux transporter [Acidimicrobiaceae bacterium]
MSSPVHSGDCRRFRVRWTREDREILRLAMPALAALIAEPLYILADTAVVGRLGTTQLGGLAVASSLLLIGYSVFIFLAYGTTATVARLLGAKELRRVAHHGIAGALAGVALVVMPPTGLAIYFRFGIDMVYAAFAVMVALSIPIALDGRPAGTSETSPMLGSLILISGSALILTSACIGALEAFMPLLAADVAQSLLTWLYIAFGLSLVVGRLAGGVLGDRIGHAPLSAVSLLGVAGAMAAVSVSAVHAVLLGAAIVTALGIRRCYDEHLRLGICSGHIRPAGEGLGIPVARRRCWHRTGRVRCWLRLRRQPERSPSVHHCCCWGGGCHLVPYGPRIPGHVAPRVASDRRRPRDLSTSDTSPTSRRHGAGIRAAQGGRTHG